MLAARSEAITRHEQLRNAEPFASQTKRLYRLTQGFAYALQAVWLTSTRCRNIFDEFLTIHFFDDTIQSSIAIMSLAKEGQLAAAKREMRYMLESCSKHVYVDLKQMGKPLPEKLVFLEQNVPRSSMSFTRDFRLCEFSESESKEFMDTISALYSELCKYVHRSREQIEETLRLYQRGIFQGFETPRELESFVRLLARLYDVVLVLHFNALGVSLAGDVFVHMLDEAKEWPYHKTKYVKRLSSYFNYKHERQSR